MNNWNSIYKTKGIVQAKPSSLVISAINHFKEKALSRILDLGCGTGRHTKMLVDTGFEVYGCDSSEKALETITNIIPKSDFRKCDMTSLPYSPEFFDGILCHQVIQHGSLAKAKEASEEILRVLRPGGLLFLTAISTEHPKFATGREIEANTRIDTDDIDGHIPHHFFSENELRELFNKFDIYDLEHFIGPSELNPNKGSAAWIMYAQKPVDSPKTYQITVM